MMIWINSLIARILPFVPKSVVGIFARQYLAGEKLSDAVASIQLLNRKKVHATLDLLGEDPKSKSDCLSAVKRYKQALDQIHAHDLDSGISLKPSHMGLKIDRKFCLENIRTLVEYAAGYDRFVRIDMEDISLKEDTIDFFLSLKKDCKNVGIVVQAYTRKSIDDVNRLIKETSNIRLCKGAYFWEDESHVYKDMAIINSSYVYLLEKLLSNGCFTAIATHDEKLVFEALKLIDRLNIPKDRYEFQMLYGVTENLRSLIVDQGHPMRVYVPFGEEWFAYSVRRLKENPKMISYILSNGLKNLFSKK